MPASAPTGADAAAARLRDLAPGFRPRVGIVLGSGLGRLADAIEAPRAIRYTEIPGFPAPGVASHGGEAVLGALGGQNVVCLKGRVHYYEGRGADAMAAPVRTLKALGCEILLITNAAGGLRPELTPGSLMAITDHINLTGANPLIGGATDDRFVDMVDAYDPALRELMRDAARREGIRLEEGVYVWFTGPSFETPAEIRAARLLGGDAVGMSTVPEVILARHCGLRVAAISNVTNLAAGMSDETLSHAHTMANAAEGAEALTRLFMAFLEALPPRAAAV